MKKTKFADSSLKDVDFSEVDLSMAYFGNCDLQNAVFHRTNLEKADLLTAANYSIDPEMNRINKAKFSYSGLPGLLEKHKIEIE